MAAVLWRRGWRNFKEVPVLAMGFQSKPISSSSSLRTEKLTKSYVHNPSLFKFPGKTVGQTLEATAAAHPNKEALVFCREGIRKTYEEFLYDVRQAAAGFISVGVNRGDRLAIWGTNSYDWVVTQFASFHIGAILVNINPAYRSAEFNYSMNKVGVKAIVSAPSFKTSDYYAMLTENCPELEDSQPGQLKSKGIPSLETVIMMGKNNLKGTYNFDDVKLNGKAEDFQKLKQIHEDLNFDDPINIQFTSGTTGFPKGCTLTHHTILNNAFSIGYQLGFNEKQEGRICLPIPLYHAFASIGGTITSVVYPAASICPSPTFDPEATMEAIDKERVTVIFGTPTIYVQILNHPKFNEYNYDSLTTGLMGGSPCPPELIKQFIENMGADEIMITNVLLQTQIIVCGECCNNDCYDTKVRQVKPKINFSQLKVVDPETKKIVPINTQGEICSRGYNVMLKYWEDEEKTREALDESGWYYTGDLGVLDEEGRLKITGRSKDMIIRGGENIFPVEIENLLLEHPKVENVQVVGIPHEGWGEEVCACIKVKDGQTATKDEIIEFCKGKITHFKVPAHVVFMDSFPLTVTFKVKKFELREIAAKMVAEK
ncbi:Acyl-CoA synthetase family member 2, mitochondrial [Holothuria leucospilota]|uniref:Medium-chain acyl-CoA ligase ACSF2, mitochondrial n=1 Tax=Holothuria leucospilota TaxID=206669 RepID=A0A9Q1BJR8_HOLLE|nr:Acyl-CoA synthetase family member 2, mitochondrial [Holothuria leucospilota]